MGPACLCRDAPEQGGTLPRRARTGQTFPRFPQPQPSILACQNLFSKRKSQPGPEEWPPWHLKDAKTDVAARAVHKHPHAGLTYPCKTRLWGPAFQRVGLREAFACHGCSIHPLPLHCRPLYRSLFSRAKVRLLLTPFTCTRPADSTNTMAHHVCATSNLKSESRMWGAMRGVWGHGSSQCSRVSGFLCSSGRTIFGGSFKLGPTAFAFRSTASCFDPAGRTARCGC
jgi:hypothetical protein|mmetsp:Transcript_57650/g.95475  ORF Transcript_57650/g.95475 Transcript_57650/m.95475 type:complete len:227 (-) Transcript_57650:1627-2307(-)